MSSLHQSGRPDGWDLVYAAKGASGVSWYQADPKDSLDWIDDFLPDRTSDLIDVGAGASMLVDGLLRRGYRSITLLDQSEVALALTRARLEADPTLAQLSSSIHWLHANLLDAVLPKQGFDLWHDRAVFHFFTSESQRHRYLQRARHSLRSGGFLLVATFAEEGPRSCSGQLVRRYSPAQLSLALGSEFDLVEHRLDSHLTPSGHCQPFLRACFRYQPHASA